MMHLYDMHAAMPAIIMDLRRDTPRAEMLSAQLIIEDWEMMIAAAMLPFKENTTGGSSAQGDTHASCI